MVAKSAFYDMLTQPFQPPPMFYERRAVLPSKTAQIEKQKSAPPTVDVQKALKEQEAKYKAQLEAKERIIRQQKEIVAR